MDTAEPLASTWPNNHGPSSSASLRLGRKRTQTSLRRAVGTDSQTRQTSPRPPAAATGKDMTAQQSKPAPTKSTSKTPTRGVSAASKPLVPLSERRVREVKKNLVGTKENDPEKWEIAPDGSSGGREGRQFTVANVGNNGRIYLRPSVRPAHQRYPQPNFTFPVTSQSTAVVDSWNKGPAKQDEVRGDQDDASNLQSTQWTPTTTSIAPPGGLTPYFTIPENPSQSQQHRRAVSDSTVHDAATLKEQYRDTFKVTITKPVDRDESRPRTMDALNQNGGPPLLDVNIPSWRLGAPRFTLRGTPLLRGSSYAPTEDMHSSGLSGLNSSWSYNLSVSGVAAKRPNPLALPMNRTPHVAQRGDSNLPSPRIQHPLRSTYMSTHLVIEPEMFTDLTFRPACDDRSIVRYSPAGVVTAATPPRLVAEITSPTFLDYELISDFFLTYRSFLEPVNLLRMLVARLRWALDRNDEPGMIVRVRTFVALRHWILNYFVDDFLVDYDLRLTFCTLVNDLVAELGQDVPSRRSQVKIVAELKKCWRRVCAQFWDGAEFDDLLGSEVAITPGGVAGNRDPGMNSSVEPHVTDRTFQGDDPAKQSNHQIARNIHAGVSFYGDIPKTVQVGDCVVLDNRPGTPEDQVGGQACSKNSPQSPLSMASLDVVSCSFPTKNLRVFNPNTAHLMAAHPVSSTSPSVVNSNGPIATTPKSLVGKRVRPNQVHKRNNSLSDSLRDHGSDKTPSTDQDLASAMPPGGSLVRGNLLPPAQAFVSIEPHAYGHSYRQTTIFQSGGRNFTKDRALGGAMSGYGMRKLLRSVRKVLKTRTHGTYSNQSNLMDIQPIGPRGATTNRLPGTAVVPQEIRRQNGQNGLRPPVRIDLLGAEVAEDFKKAIREEEEAIAAAADSEQLGGHSLQGPNSAPLPTYPEYSAAQIDSTALEALTLNQNRRPISDMGITIGSKSIVIVDDTLSFEIPSIQGTSRAENLASYTPAGTLLRGGGADPTPPNTPPPGHSVEDETPSRLSNPPSQHHKRPLEDNILPPFIPDLATLGGNQSSQASREPSQPSLLAIQQAGRQPTMNGAILLPHRTRSTKNHQSLNSILHRRITSLGSTSIPPTIRSFDATTDSSGLDAEPRSEAPAPSPLLVLRRRPGGDLKAATHIGDLNPSMLRRSRSVGSLATFTESIRSSYVFTTRPNSSGDHDISHKRNAQDRAGMFSLGQLAEKGLKRDISLFSTHSSKPNMRPSFEAEAQRLAQIPDEENDGIESALLKLEGKYPKKPMKLSIVGQSPEVSKNTVNEFEQPMPPAGPQENPTSVLDQVQQRSSMDKSSSSTDSTQVDESVFAPPIDQRVRKVQKSSRDQMSFLSESSLDSDYSIPLLDRGLVDEVPKAAVRVWAGRSILRGSDDEESAVESEQNRDQTSRSETKHSSFDVVQRTDSIEKIQPGDTLPSISWDMADESFLRDGSDTDLSSEISGTNLDSQDAERRDDNFSGDDLPAHSFTKEPTVSPSQLISDPPKAMAHALAMSPLESTSLSKPDLWSSKPLPPTPELTPVMSFIDKPYFGQDMSSTPQRIIGASKHGAVGNLKYSVHLPFILAFDSDVLAQQFTLIEKDALNEIDWKELIDMNWKNSASNNSRSWVDFLRHTDAQGVDVVIARFNIMVKWALSEIVLTQHVEERARCIIKLIHIASHCRRYRNFATMAQLTIALSSNEIARLPRTWELVPASDLKTLNDLELLVTPSRNFRSIREEMEMGADAGCIPFVGIYTHDLLYNAQRASEIASSPSTAPLVNFEKYRMGASVVKTLLRLLEASTRYTFQPIEGVTERCLWIGALSDEDIRERCQSLE